MVFYFILAIPFVVLCYYEGMFIHGALEDTACKMLMQGEGFRTPFLAEIGIVWMIIDCLMALSFVLLFLSAVSKWLND
jgi:hypothetical protein